jgi:hypothetical protein
MERWSLMTEISTSMGGGEEEVTSVWLSTEFIVNE